MHPTYLPKLPYDVLLLIASFASKRTVLSLMLTCHALHLGCAKYVLAEPVRLDGCQKIASFIYFMRPGKRARWHHLRSLSLDSGSEPVSYHVAGELARVIPRASNLEVLHIEDAEQILGAHPDLALSFANLKSVKHLFISGGYEHTCRMLEAMHWPLESAILQKTDHGWRWDDPHRLDRMHPALLLKNARSTLKSLECEDWRECSDWLSDYPVYPQLRTLHVEGIWCPRPLQWTISYPSLKVLSVHTLEDHFMNVEEEDLHEYAFNRRTNLEELSPLGSWEELERFSGGALDLYLLGLPCRIRNVSLNLGPDSVRFFGPVLEKAKPISLRLHIRDGLFSAPIPTYLQDPGLAQLCSLSLDIALSLPTYNMDMEKIFDNMLVAFNRLTLRELAITIICRNRVPTARGTFSPERMEDPDDPTMRELVQTPGLSVLCSVQSWIDALDVATFSRWILDSVTSLESVDISIELPEATERKVARSCRKRSSNGDPHVVEPLAS